MKNKTKLFFVFLGLLTGLMFSSYIIWGYYTDMSEAGADMRVVTLAVFLILLQLTPAMILFGKFVSNKVKFMYEEDEEEKTGDLVAVPA